MIGKYRRKTLGLVCLSMGIGILLALLMNWIGFFVAVGLIAFGFWQFLC